MPKQSENTKAEQCYTKIFPQLVVEVDGSEFTLQAALVNKKNHYKSYVVNDKEIYLFDSDYTRNAMGSSIPAVLKANGLHEVLSGRMMPRELHSQNPKKYKDIAFYFEDFTENSVYFIYKKKEN